MRKESSRITHYASRNGVMMATNQRTQTQRLQYFEGQLLTARDLQDDAAFETRLRGLHVNIVHNTWGVALGFEVAVAADGTAVTVNPGIAYDCRGREIVSVRSLSIGLPILPRQSQAEAWWFDLVVRYDETIGQEPTVYCVGNGISAREERPFWRWCFAGDVADPDLPPADVSAEVRLGEEVPLARFVIGADSQVVGQPDLSIRRNAQGLVRPHIASGSNYVEIKEDFTNLSLSAWIDTTAGGFSQTPAYFANVELPTTILEMLTTEYIGPFVSIRSPNRHGFWLDVRIAELPIDIELAAGSGVSHMMRSAAARKNDVPLFKVNWFGIEPNEGCPPEPTFLYFFWYTPIFMFGTINTPRFNTVFS
jgi:hypothetical protein